MSRKFTIEAIFSAIDHFTQPLGRMATNSQTFAARVSKSFEGIGKSTDSVIKGIEKVGRRAAVAGAAVALIGRDVINTGVEFDRTIVSAAAKFDPALKRGTKGFDQLREAAEKAGATTEFSGTQAAKALEAFASGGMSPESAKIALPVTVDFATATKNDDLGNAADTIMKSLGALNLMTDDPIQLQKNILRLTDSMSKAADSTMADINAMGDTIKRSGSISASAGQQLETYMALLGGLASNSEFGGDAGTTMKNMFKRLAAPPKMAKDALQSLKVKTLDKKGDMLPILDILREIDEKTKKMGSGQRLGVLNKIFGEEASSGVIALLNTGIDKIDKWRKQIEGAAGSTKALAETMRDTAGGDIDNFTSSLEGVKLAIFNLNQGPLRDAVQAMTKWVDANKGLIVQKVQDTVGWIAEHFEDIVKWGERISSAVLAIYAINGAAKVVVGGFEAVANVWGGLKKAWEYAPYLWRAISMAGQAAMFALRLAVVGVIEAVMFLAANPIALLIIAVIAAAAAIYIYWDPIKAYFVELGEGITAVWASVAESAGGMWTSAVETLKGVWSPVADFFSGLWDGIVSTFNGALDTILEGIKSAANAVEGVFGGGDVDVAVSGGGGAGGDMRSVSNEIMRREMSETRSSFSETYRHHGNHQHRLRQRRAPRRRVRLRGSAFSEPSAPGVTGLR